MNRKPIDQLKISDYKLVIFDFDGVIADSLGVYRDLDLLLIKELYGVEVGLDEIQDLFKKIRTGAINNSEADYYHAIDLKYGDGTKSFDEILETVYELAPVVQKNIKPKDGVVEVLKYLKNNFSAPITLATGSGYQIIESFTAEDSAIGREINLIEFFDKIVTYEDVENPKPDPEAFMKIIDFYNVEPKSVLIFEDSLAGVTAGKSAGATVVAIEDIHNEAHKNEIMNAADFYLEDWKQFPFLFDF